MSGAMDAVPPGKARSMAALVAGCVLALCVWFSATAALPGIVAEAALSPARQAMLTGAVQIGFVAGALASAVSGLADRLDPRRVMAASAAAAALANAAFLAVAPGGDAALACRFLTGAFLAGVYPVGMKIAAGWGLADRGLLVGTLVGALTLGSAAPHLLSGFAPGDWRWTVAAGSACAALGAACPVAAGLGPHHARAAAFRPSAILALWRDRGIRFATLGYLGHMWELYAMWAWIGAFYAASFAAADLSATGMSGPDGPAAGADAAQAAKLAAFATVAAGAPACVLGGWIADRVGRVRLARAAMLLSGGSALAMAALFGGPAWATVAVGLIWGATIVMDSAQFSATVADLARPDLVGSLLTLQTCLGFALTLVTIQALPLAVELGGWPAAAAALAIGPFLGVVAMGKVGRP